MSSVKGKIREAIHKMVHQTYVEQQGGNTCPSYFTYEPVRPKLAVGEDRPGQVAEEAKPQQG